MWTFEHLPQPAQADVVPFLRSLRRAEVFDPGGEPAHVARAPASVELLGGSTERHGGTVLRYPLAAGAYVAAQVDPRPLVRVESVPASGLSGARGVELPLDVVRDLAATTPYAAVHSFFARDPERAWVANVLAGMALLARECAVPLERGMRWAVYSDVPPGRELGGSAAIRTATLAILNAMHNLELTDEEIGLYAQAVGLLVPGARDSVAEPLAAAYTPQDHLLAVAGDPPAVRTALPWPAEVELWVLDAEVSPDAPDAYERFCVGAAMGYRILAGLTGLPAEQLADGRVRIDGGRFEGHLANVTPALWEKHFRSRIPERLSGADFLQEYGGVAEAGVSVDPQQAYDVRRATALVVYEQHRAQCAVEILATGSLHAPECAALGELLLDSHVGGRACRLGSAYAHALADIVSDEGARRGLCGARGAGASGTTVAVLSTRHSYSEIRALAQQAAEATGVNATIRSGSSPGLAQWGVQRLVYR